MLRCNLHCQILVQSQLSLTLLFCFLFFFYLMSKTCFFFCFLFDAAIFWEWIHCTVEFLVTLRWYLLKIKTLTFVKERFISVLASWNYVDFPSCFIFKSKHCRTEIILDVGDLHNIQSPLLTGFLHCIHYSGFHRLYFISYHWQAWPTSCSTKQRYNKNKNNTAIVHRSTFPQPFWKTWATQSCQAVNCTVFL